MKIKLIVPALLITSSAIIPVVSCGNNDSDDPKVTENEFVDALSFKNDDYIQLNQIHNNTDGGQNVYNIKYSPTITYSETTLDFPSEHVHEYLEQYVKKEGEGYLGLKRTNEEQEQYSEMTPEQAEIEFVTKEWLINWLFSPSSFYEYSKYEFDETTKSYITTYDGSDEYNVTYTIELKFNNKKLINIKHCLLNLPTKIMTETNFTYNHITPTWPTQNKN